MRYTIPALAVLACALTACKPQPISPADETAIRALATSYETAANAGSVDGITALYTADATVQPPNMPAAAGTAAIHKLYSDMMGPTKTALRLTVTKTFGQGDIAYDLGTYHVVVTMKDSTQASPPPEDGKFIDVVLRQSDGSWKYAASTWNANAMPAAPAPPARPRRH